MLIVCSFFISLGPSQLLFAKVIELTEARNLREAESEDNPNAPLGLVGRINAGSQIEIPDEYCVFNNDKFDFDASVKLWMQSMSDKEGIKPEFAKFNATQKDYFIPVNVTKAAAGSKLKENGKFTNVIPDKKVFFISIRDVAVSIDSSMKTAQASNLYVPPKKVDPKIAATRLEAVSGEACVGDCHKPDLGLSGLESHVQAQTTHLAKIQKVMDNQFDPMKIANAPTAEQALIEVRKKRDLSATPLLKASDAQIIRKFSDVDANMKKTCGFGLDDFLPEIQKQVKFTPFTASELISIMSHESSGVCFPKSRAIKDPMEHGLFGITNSDSKIAQTEQFCGKNSGIDSRAGVKSAVISGEAFSQLSAYATNPKVHCVGNPFLNLQASVRILKQKLEDYQRRNPRANIIDQNGKLSPSAFKYISELYAGQGMKSYGRSTAGDAIKLDRVIQDFYLNQAAETPAAG